MDGAGNGTRTRDTKLGKLVLYQLSYARSDHHFSPFIADEDSIVNLGSQEIFLPSKTLLHGKFVRNREIQ